MRVKGWVKFIHIGLVWRLKKINQQNKMELKINANQRYESADPYNNNASFIPRIW